MQKVNHLGRIAPAPQQRPSACFQSLRTVHVARGGVGNCEFKGIKV
jgi:hypothetical protein